MANWNQVLGEINSHNSYDVLRKEYLRKIAEHTNRNVMIYYSGWLQNPKPGVDYSISDADKNGFMACCPKKKERRKGLDLILHTPGGRVDATESLIDYLYELYAGNIRAFVPQLAMLSKAHSRHIGFRQAKSAGLKVKPLERDNELQDLVLSLHHLLCLTFLQTSTVKIFANNLGNAYVIHGTPASK